MFPTCRWWVAPLAAAGARGAEETRHTKRQSSSNKRIASRRERSECIKRETGRGAVPYDNKARGVVVVMSALSDTAVSRERGAGHLASSREAG